VDIERNCSFISSASTVTQIKLSFICGTEDIHTYTRQTDNARSIIPKPPYHRSSKEAYNYIIRAAKNTHLKIVTYATGYFIKIEHNLRVGTP
jgi:thioester reductase-like protein